MLWMEDPYRPTLDVDLLASGPSDAASVEALMNEICAVECPEDGLTYDLASMRVVPIRALQEYEGQRVKITTLLGRTRIRLQVDLGFGDAAVPSPEEAEYPTLLDDLPAPNIRAYRREASIAEKFEAMVKLGRINSRMKDFHDVWAVSSQFPFDGKELLEAVRACFARRKTDLHEAPEVLRPAFYEEKRLVKLWRDYLAEGAFLTPPPSSFASIGERIRGFLGPLREHLVRGEEFRQRWEAKGPWSQTPEEKTP